MAGCKIKSATLIDNIYTNINDWNEGISGVLHSDDIIGNDHKIIFYIRINSELPYYKKYRKQRDFSLKICSPLESFTRTKNGNTYMK